MCGAEIFVARTEIVSRTADERLAVYSLLINGLSLRVPQAYADRPEEFVQLVKSLPHVTRGTTLATSSVQRKLLSSHLPLVLHIIVIMAVTREKKYQQNLFATINAINATLAYNSPAIGNVSNAGAGIKVSEDHHLMHMSCKLIPCLTFVFMSRSLLSIQDSITRVRCSTAHRTRLLLHHRLPLLCHNRHALEPFT